MPAPPPTATPSPAPTQTPQPPAAVETPDPPAAPAFAPTDWIGTHVPVNLRAGPGAAYATLGLLPRGTPLAATGEQREVDGVLWRRFILADGRAGWVRDLDTLPEPP